MGVCGKCPGSREATAAYFPPPSFKSAAESWRAWGKLRGSFVYRDFGILGFERQESVPALLGCLR